MVAHKNFYETINEARMRLKHTIVKYKDDFYAVLEVGNHKPDGKFRVYMDELGHGEIGRRRHGKYFPTSDDWGSDCYYKLDDFLEKNPNSGLVRKYADSRHFEKFRPFPLGNVNTNGGVLYCERSPTRNMHQGLLNEAIMTTRVDTAPPQHDPNGKGLNSTGINSLPIGNEYINPYSSEFLSMLRNEYPSYDEVVNNLRDPNILNKGCAFHREYSVLRGPLDTLILCNQHWGVGFITANNTLLLGDSHEFLREELQEFNIFKSIQVKEVSSYGGD